MKTPIEVLKQYWGHSEFRPPQEAVIESVLNKNDTIDNISELCNNFNYQIINIEITRISTKVS